MSRVECGVAGVFATSCPPEIAAGGAASIVLHGPRGGTIGSTIIGRANAEAMYAELGRILGKHDAPRLRIETGRLRPPAAALVSRTYEGDLVDVKQVHDEVYLMLATALQQQPVSFGCLAPHLRITRL